MTTNLNQQARLQINLTEVFGPCELIKEVIDSGNWVPVSYCDFIQGLVINAESLGPVTHYFGHPNDDYTRICPGSQNDLFPEKNNFFLPLQH
jgi:hypothetical protein